MSGFSFIGKLIKGSLMGLGVLFIMGMIGHFNDWNINLKAHANKVIETDEKEPTTVKEEPKVVAVKKTKVQLAHEQYAYALSIYHKGYRYKSTYLPRYGITKGDDWRNCLNMKYWNISTKDADIFDGQHLLNKSPADIMNGPNAKQAMEFCQWHAGMGSKWVDK